jgi:hypothetical protein
MSETPGASVPKRKKIESHKPKPKTIDSYVAALLQGIARGKTALKIGRGARLFSQGDRADALYFIENR